MFLGFAQTFFGGVYGTCLGYTAQFGEMRKSVVGLSGVAIGLGKLLHVDAASDQDRCSLRVCIFLSLQEKSWVRSKQ